MALDLVLDLRVELAVAAQAHADAQAVHRAQVVLPLRVDLVEEEEPLEPAHVLDAELLLAPPPAVERDARERLGGLDGPSPQRRLVHVRRALVEPRVRAMARDR